MSETRNHATDGVTYMEMLAVSAARVIQDEEVVFVGTGLPMMAALLAKACHAPNITMITEAGIYNPRPMHIPMSVSDSRWFYRSSWVASPLELLNMFLQNKRIDVGFLGGAQVDKYGGLNSTLIGGDYLNPKRRLPGSGGAVDIACLSNKTIITMVHERRRFVEKLDYLTSPGWKCYKFPGRELVRREELGMWGGPQVVISDMGIMNFDKETKEMFVDQYFADLGVTLEQIKSNTAFDIDVSRAKPAVPPTAHELTMLREKIDPDKVFLGRKRKE